ncbi:MAG TPA: autotransporter-associated beta strand repeat-containing protein [Lacipirellulaceae bacterium]|jgi:autotransporter-associated beta strand protein|nr:autotransporter-associated beta strand repeat-containing protein [Lacipirellulaceae bacterium]
MAGNYSVWRFSSTTLAILLATTCSAQIALAQYTYVQDTDSDGHWDFPSSWTDGASNTTFPNAVGATALINSPDSTVAAAYQLFLPAGDITVGELKIDNTNFANTYRTTFNNGDVNGVHFRLVFQSTSGPAKYTETMGTAPGPTNTQTDFKGGILVNSDLIINQDNYPNLNTGTIFEQLVEGAADKTIYKEGHGGIQFNYNAVTFPPFNETPFQGHVVIDQGGIRLLSASPFSNVAGVTVNSGGQLMLACKGANANPDFSLAPGAVLNLNGAGKATDVPLPQTVASPEGALRISITPTLTDTAFHSPVVLQSDSVISVDAGGTTGTLDGMLSGPGGLTKQGAGTLILSNASDSYSGDTKVLAGGPLSITNPFLADGRDVSLVTGSIFDLNFSATDTIRSFYIDGVGQATGTWGAVGSIAAHQSALITGTGLLNVTTLPPMGVPGDYNGNGVVDAADYVLWRSGGPLQNEVATMGSVTPEDYTEWRARFGNTSGSGSGALSGSAAVPEPGSLLLATFAALGLVVLPRKR